MKNLILIICTVSFLFACKDKDAIPDPNSGIIAPKADFNYTLAENGVVNIQFVLNYKDRYVIDGGVGNLYIDSVTYSGAPLNFPFTKALKFSDNGNYSIKLTVSNSKGTASSSQTIKIDNILPPPIASFTYEKTADGGIKLNNKSENYQTVEWRLTRKGDYVGFTSKVEDPGYKFENNGTYFISLTAVSKYGVSHFKRDSVKITNAPNINNPVFEGTFFDQDGKIPGSGINTLGEPWGAVGLSNFAVNHFLLKEKGNILLMLGRPESSTVEAKYNFYKQKFKIGKLEKGEIDILISNNTVLWSPGQETTKLWDDPAATAEIIEVSEVTQPKLFAEMYEKAFWVTFRLKADFGSKGKVDGKLKVRYLVY